MVTVRSSDIARHLVCFVQRLSNSNNLFGISGLGGGMPLLSAILFYVRIYAYKYSMMMKVQY